MSLFYSSKSDNSIFPPKYMTQILRRQKTIKFSFKVARHNYFKNLSFKLTDRRINIAEGHQMEAVCSFETTTISSNLF
jgi:hypothetical protein